MRVLHRDASVLVAAIESVDGSYRFDDLDPGPYRVLFSAPGPSSRPTFYPHGSSFRAAKVIELGPGDELTGIDGLLPFGFSDTSVSDPRGAGIG